MGVNTRIMEKRMETIIVKRNKAERCIIKEKGLGFRVKGLGFRVKGLGSRV